MQIIFFVFHTFFYNPIVNLLVFIYTTLNSFGLPGAVGFSIILLTVVIKFITWPLTSSQLKSSKKMMDLRPHLDILKKKHKDDKQGLAKATMDLYKEHGVSPASGCLPALLQLPLFISLIQVIPLIFGGQSGIDKINAVLYNSSWALQTPPSPYFFGINLSLKPSDFAQVGVLVLLIPFITAGIQFVQSIMMMPKDDLTINNKDDKEEKKEKEEATDSMMAMQSQMMYMMPLMLGIFAYTFQLGVAIYLNTLTLLNIYQQYKISGWGKLPQMIERAQILVGIKSVPDMALSTTAATKSKPKKKSKSKKK